MFSLDSEFIDALLEKTIPSYQATSRQDGNLGYGFLFYAMARLIRPATVVVIGSKAGFSVIVLAAAVRDNAGTLVKEVGCNDTKLVHAQGKGIVHFIDPSYSEARNEPGHWHGIGFWDDPEKVIKHWRAFGVSDYVQHHKMTSQAFVDHGLCPGLVDLLYIDGDHSYDGILGDFQRFYPFLRDGAVVLAHDVDPKLAKHEPGAGGYQALSDLDRDKFEFCRLPVFPGMAIARKRH